jgi:hypothetical protein
MPKFHFEIVDGYMIEDPVGLDCKNEEQAKKRSRRYCPPDRNRRWQYGGPQCSRSR